MTQTDEIKHKIDIVELIGSYVKLKKAGRNYKGLCPFHGEKSPSFMVNPELQIYKCFGCAEGGDVFTFLQKIEGLNFYESLQQLAQKAGVTLTSYKPSSVEEQKDRLLKIHDLAAKYYQYLLHEHKLGTQALAYLTDIRGLSLVSIRDYQLGFAPNGWNYLKTFLAKKGFTENEMENAGLIIKTYDRFRNRLIFPLANHRGEVVGFSGRVMPGGDEKSAKYINSPETPIYHKGEILYGFDRNKQAIRQADCAVVVEGEIDAIASWQAGIKNVVAIKGSALTEGHIRTLKRICSHIVLALDADVAGDLAARRGFQMAESAGMIVKVATWDNTKDPGELAIKQPNVWQEAVNQARPIYDYLIDSGIHKYGLTGPGIKKLASELTPILAEIEDEIVKSHYVKLLADKLQVEPDAVWQQVSKKHKNGDTGRVETLAVKNLEIDELEVCEQTLVEIALKLSQKDHLPELHTPFWFKVATWFKDQPDTAINRMPDHLRTRVEELLLSETEYTPADWTKALKRWESVYIKRKLSGKDKLQDSELLSLSKRLGTLDKPQAIGYK